MTSATSAPATKLVTATSAPDPTAAPQMKLGTGRWLSPKSGLCWRSIGWTNPPGSAISSVGCSIEGVESQIPIQNIYYLLCYAWNKLEEGEVVGVSAINSTRLVDLFAKVLAGGTHHLIRRGFDRGYLAFAEETPRIRGKIDFSSSLKRNLLARGQARCEYEELDHNVLHNQILKTTLERLSLAEGLDTKLREE